MLTPCFFYPVFKPAESSDVRTGARKQFHERGAGEPGNGAPIPRFRQAHPLIFFFWRVFLNHFKWHFLPIASCRHNKKAVGIVLRKRRY